MALALKSTGENVILCDDGDANSSAFLSPTSYTFVAPSKWELHRIEAPNSCFVPFLDQPIDPTPNVIERCLTSIIKCKPILMMIMTK